MLWIYLPLSVRHEQRHPWHGVMPPESDREITRAGQLLAERSTWLKAWLYLELRICDIASWESYAGEDSHSRQ